MKLQILDAKGLRTETELDDSHRPLVNWSHMIHTKNRFMRPIDNHNFTIKMIPILDL